jgi:hypothetical protein
MHTITLKRQEEKTLATVDDSGTFVLEKANNLSIDLMEEELTGTKTHKEISVQPKKQVWVYKKKVKESKIPCRRSKRQKIRTKMKGCFWNGDSVGDLAKHSFVHESIREHKLYFFAILETGRSRFSRPFLNHLSGGLDYIWYCLPPQGRSGNILVGINNATLRVNKMSNGDFSVKFHVRSKSDGFDWILVPVYGAAQDDKKLEFLSEFLHTFDNESLPLLIG